MRGRKNWHYWLGGLFLLLLNQCAVQFYPRAVSQKQKIQTNFAYSVDTLGASLFRSTKGRKAKSPERQKMIIENYLFYADPKFQDPNHFYPEPGEIKDMEMTLFKEEKDYEVYFLKWSSSYEPVNPEFWRLYQDYKENWTVFALYFKHKNPVQAGMVVTHGWTGGKITKKNMFFPPLVPKFVEKGFDVIFVQQPYHGLRMPKDSYFSGELFISSEVSRLNEAMCQAVTDMRSAIRWLKQDHQLVGMFGGSLGGVVSLETAVVEPELDFVIARVPPTSWADLTLSSALVPYVGQGIWDSGIGLETARKIFYPTSPANFSPVLAKEDILIISGMGDNFVPVNQSILIWERWDKPEIFWFAGGHILNFETKEALRIEEQFLYRQLKKLNKVVN